MLTDPRPTPNKTTRALYGVIFSARVDNTLYMYRLLNNCYNTICSTLIEHVYLHYVSRTIIGKTEPWVTFGL